MITDEEIDDHIAAVHQMNCRMRDELIEVYTAEAEQTTNPWLRDHALKKLERLRAMDTTPPKRYAPILAENRRRWAEAEAMAAASSPQGP